MWHVIVVDENRRTLAVAPEGHHSRREAANQWAVALHRWRQAGHPWTLVPRHGRWRGRVGDDDEVVVRTAPGPAPTVGQTLTSVVAFLTEDGTLSE